MALREAASGDEADRTKETSADRGDASPAKRLNAPLAYLRAFIIVLVVAYHAALSYNTILPATLATSLAEHLSTMRAVSPVNDAVRSELLGLLTGFNDTFLMALMFLLSGLFVWRSLRRKGSAIYLRDRAIRLGIPILVMILLRPVTYYPTYLQLGGQGGPAGFWQAWSAIEWRGGPIWFLLLLLAFDLVVALLARLRREGRGASRWMASDLPRKPFRLFLLILLLSAIAYIPITAVIGSFSWLQVGPAQIQVNRVLHYAAYFLAGIAIGAYGIEDSCLGEDASLARRWPLWTVSMLLVFAVYIVVAVSVPSEAIVGTLYVLTCAVSSFAFLSLFLRFVRTRRPVLDSLFYNSYGIYIVHYGVVSWLAFALLGAAMPAMAKFLLVFVGTMAICWALVALLRRIPLVAKVI